MKFKLSIQILAAVLVSAGPCFAQTKVRVNWGAVSGVMSGIWLAHDEGLFRKNGLEVELLHIPSTSRALQSMLAGEIQFTTADALNSIQAVLTGADVVMVCEGINRFVFSVMARPEIKRVSELKGKKIGITRVGSSTHTATVYVVNRAGLHPSDYTLLPLVEVPNILTALLAGHVDAGVLSPPTNSRAKKAGMVELQNLAVDGPEYPSTTIASTRAFVKTNPDAVRRYVRAMAEAFHVFRTNKQIGIRTLQKYSRVQDADILEDTYRQFRDAFDPVPYVSRAGITSLLTSMGEKEPKARQLKLDDVMDMRFVAEVEKEAYFQKLWGK